MIKFYLDASQKIFVNIIHPQTPPKIQKLFSHSLQPTPERNCTFSCSTSAPALYASSCTHCEILGNPCKIQCYPKNLENCFNILSKYFQQIYPMI